MKKKIDLWCINWLKLN